MGKRGTRSRGKKKFKKSDPKNVKKKKPQNRPFPLNRQLNPSLIIKLNDFNGKKIRIFVAFGFFNVPSDFSEGSFCR